MGPTERIDISPSETQVYQGKLENIFKFISRLLVLILAIPLLVGLFFLRIYLETGSFHFAWTIHHLKPVIMPGAMMFLLCLFLVYLRIKNRNLKIEISQEGIAQVNGSGQKIFIPWKEMGELPSSGGAFVTVKDKTGKLKITVSSLFEDYEKIKKRVFAEYENKQGPPPNEGRVYAMAPFVGSTYFLGGIIFLLFGLGALACAVASSLGLLPSHVSQLTYSLIMLFCGLFFLIPGIYCFWWGPKVSQSKIRVSQGGIERLEKDGTSVFIRWEDIVRLVKRERMKQLGVYSFDSAKKLMVDYQYESYEQIRDRVLEEFEKKFRLPSLPVTYGQLPVLPNLVFLGFIACIMGGLLWVAFRPETQGRGAVWGIIGFLGVMCLLNIFEESGLVKAVTLEETGTTLHRLFGKTILLWKEINQVSMEAKAVKGGTYYVMVLADQTGKKYKFSNSLGTKLEVYIALKKVLDGR